MLTRKQYLGGGGGAWLVYVRENSEMSGFRSFCDHPRFYRFFQEQLLTIVEIWAASGIWKRSSPDLSLTSVPDNQ